MNRNTSSECVCVCLYEYNNVHLQIDLQPCALALTKE